MERIDITSWFARIRTLAIGLVAFALASCAVQPHRPYTQAERPGTPCNAPASADAQLTTPEIRKNYTLHFVEFDDQGWAFPNDDPSSANRRTPGQQIDCAIADLRGKLEAENGKVLTFVYVHGWKHSAAADDYDVDRFRRLLDSRASYFPDRRIVGIYVGWQGNTIDLWGVRNINFWSRKNAASHVADGRVRELFSRIRGLRDYWNGPIKTYDHDCDSEPSGEDRCPLRTIMIGHSFGGLILFSSAAPYLMEMLSAERDLPPDGKRQRAARSRGIADLIVLLNPAFEGSLYAPVFEAGLHYRPSDNEPPLVVTLTTTADVATKNFFPVARWFNSVFQYPASSDEESNAMKRTPGNIDRFLTHKLCNREPECDGPDAVNDPSDSELKWGRREDYCGMTLRSYVSREKPDRSIVWNVRTHAEVIPNHSDIDQPSVFQFIGQIYSNVTGLRTRVCEQDFGSSADPAAAGATLQAAGNATPR